MKKQRVVLSFCVFVVSWVLTVGYSIAAGAPAKPLKPTDACAALSGKRIPASEIGLPTGGAVVQSAVLVPAAQPGNVNGEFCRVRGVIRPVDPKAPNIKFQVNLPTAWNKKSVQMGGGGTNGVLVTGEEPLKAQPPGTNPLKLGYVTLGSDGGHDSQVPFDTTFALNEESFINFGYQQIKKTNDVAMLIVKSRYGMLPLRKYFAGGSQGGHEALDAAVRYPEDYDGVVVGYPAYNVTMMHLGSNHFARALYANAGKGWISPNKMKKIFETILADCDELDGAPDRIVSNPGDPACTAKTSHYLKKDDSNPLRCPGGTDQGDACLSDAQIDTVNTLNSRFNLGFTIAGGLSGYAKWPILDGTAFVAENLGAKPTYSNPPAGPDAFQYKPSHGTIRAIITKNLFIDSISDDPVKGFVLKDWANRIIEVSNIMDGSSVDMDSFRDKGGKVLMFHGTNDSSITPYNTYDLFDRMVARYTRERLDTFLLFYKIPGFGHGRGDFNAQTDWLGALDAWVDKGVAPGELTAIDGNTTPATAATNGRTRPVCVYPMWPKYTGPTTKTQAEINDAKNYICTK